MRNGSDCANILENYPDTRLRDGVYNIMVSNKTKAVYCDMTTDNGGWTLHLLIRPVVVKRLLTGLRRTITIACSVLGA
uniref:Uncharacterized protein n=1 Tax=Magallana gigas TaxID=29159 RepID=K1Q088_MAGGI